MAILTVNSSVAILSKDPNECNHGIVFDEEASKGLEASEVRKRWPRFFGTCTHCGYHGIFYASFAHYISGDW